MPAELLFLLLIFVSLREMREHTQWDTFDRFVILLISRNGFQTKSGIEIGLFFNHENVSFTDGWDSMDKMSVMDGV